jgi:(p)ppGpp synthase/HD superfamily hydrolase
MYENQQVSFDLNLKTKQNNRKKWVIMLQAQMEHYYSCIAGLLREILPKQRKSGKVVRKAKNVFSTYCKHYRS